MTEPGWEPANPVEREMADALGTRDGARYATLLMAAPLYLPVLPERAVALQEAAKAARYALRDSVAFLKKHL
jgi:hypothetical protein